MQSDDENFEESLETHSPVRKTEDPEDRYSLRRTPARSQSEKQLEAKMDQQKLFEDLCKGSAATAPIQVQQDLLSEICNQHLPQPPNHLQLRKTTRRKKRRIDYRR